MEKIKHYWNEHHESLFAVTMLFLAALLAINDLVAGRYGDDEILLTNEKSNQFQWYQSKSIKEYVVKGQADLLETILKAEMIKGKNAESFKTQHKKLEENIERYKKEKQEILLGSETVGKENWVQDMDGKMGVVPGVKVIEKELMRLGAAGDKFDIASLFFQISLMVGALGMMMKKVETKKFAMSVVLFLGILGVSYSVKALLLVL